MVTSPMSTPRFSEHWIWGPFGALAVAILSGVQNGNFQQLASLFKDISYALLLGRHAPLSSKKQDISLKIYP